MDSRLTSLNLGRQESDYPDSSLFSSRRSAGHEVALPGLEDADDDGPVIDVTEDMLLRTQSALMGTNEGFSVKEDLKRGQIDVSDVLGSWIGLE